MAAIYLIDASPYIFRAYFALPATITSPQGKQVNAVYGFAEFLIQILKKARPTHIAVAFDGSLTTSFRNEIYPEYKAQRALPPAELEAQLRCCFDVTEAMGMAAFIDDRYEADDLIAMFAHALAGREIVVVSGDKDLTQLVNERTTFWDFAKNERYGVQEVKKKFGVWPQQIPDLLALMGDAVDNIPGVNGIGRKTAVALLQHFQTIEHLYDNLDSLDSVLNRAVQSVKRRLQAGKEAAYLSKRLVSLASEAEVPTNLEGLRYRGVRTEKIEVLFQELGFTQIKERIPGILSK